MILNRAYSTASNGLLTGLQAHYDLDEASGTIGDSHNSFDSVAESGIVYGATGALGDAVTFGSGDYVHFGNNFNFEKSHTFTYSVWVNRASDGSNHTIFGKWNTSNNRGLQIQVRNTDVLRVLLSNGSSNRIDVLGSQSITAASGWQHIVVTYDGSEAASGVSIYVDGTLDASPTISEDTLTATIVVSDNFNMGSRNEGTNSFDGDIDHADIYDIEASSGIVTTLHNSGTPLAYSSYS